ncbi:MAG: radical SAM family heme chaperone HemW [Firmicutes bacterium]|nr:radical SAM family heme chaperone HemW [Bacillota bacterium]
MQTNKTGLYIHIPFCTSKCGYCSFFSIIGSDAEKENYINAMLKEIELEHGVFSGLEIDTIYFGGGTPSCLSNGLISKILDKVANRCKVDKNCEITVEANPESCDYEFVNECKNAGINRISLGLQSDDDKLLKKIERGHSFRDFQNALNMLLKNGITNISVDLISGLPTQSPGNFQKTLKNISLLPIKHISLYGLTIDEGTSFYAQSIQTNPDVQRDMYDIAVDIFETNGFFRYEVSNFAKDKYKSRHNSKYWEHSNYLALGITGNSFFDDERKKCVSSIKEYLNHDFRYEKNLLTKNDKIFEYIMLSLRTSKGIDLNHLKINYNHNLIEKKEEIIKRLISQGLLLKDGNFLKCSKNAFYVLNSLILELV